MPRLGSSARQFLSLIPKFSPSLSLTLSLTALTLIVLSRFSPVQLFATLWTAAHQAPLFMGFSRQEYWSELPCPPPGDLPGPGIESESPPSSALQADSLPAEPPGTPLTLTAPPYFNCASLKTTQMLPAQREQRHLARVRT